MQQAGFKKSFFSFDFFKYINSVLKYIKFICKYYTSYDYKIFIYK